jgi:cell division protein FtsI/penicillin-binding protein 2
VINRRDRIRFFWRRILRLLTVLREPPSQGTRNKYGSFLNLVRGVSHRRILIVTALFGLWMLVIASRLVYVQVVQHDNLTARAILNTQAKFEIPAIRGDISGRNGWILARDIEAISIYADPSEIQDIKKTAHALSPLAKTDALSLETLLQTAQANDRKFVWIVRKLTPNESIHQITDNLPGIQLINEPKRVYPFGKLAANVLGFVGTDHIGLFGLEMTQNEYLQGEPLSVFTSVDGLGNNFDYPDYTNVKGNNVFTTIDEYIQAKAMILADLAMEDTNAQSVSVLVIKPKTGEIVTLLSSPSFDPNAPKKAELELYRVDAVQDLYELDSGFAQNLLDGLQPVKKPKPANQYSFKSLTQHIEALGFGTRTGIELPDEYVGTLQKKESKLEPILIRTNLVQLTSAIGAIGNGGVLARPHLIGRIENPEGTIVPRMALESRRAIDQMVAKSIIEEFKRSYRSKQSRWAREYEIAATIIHGTKTIHGEVQSVAAVVGVVPANDPEYAVTIAFGYRAGQTIPTTWLTETFDRIVKATQGGYSVEKTLDF